MAIQHQTSFHVSRMSGLAEAINDPKLLAAVHNEDIDKVRQSLALPASPQAKTIAIRETITKGNAPILEALLTIGIPITEKSRGKLVLLAAQRGKLSIIQLLIKNGSFLKHHRGQALIEATAIHRLDIVQELFSSGEIKRKRVNESIQLAETKGFSDIKSVLESALSNRKSRSKRLGSEKRQASLPLS